MKKMKGDLAAFIQAKLNRGSSGNCQKPSASNMIQISLFALDLVDRMFKQVGVRKSIQTAKKLFFSKNT